MAVYDTVEALLLLPKIDRREAQMLLAEVLGVSRASLIAHGERRVDAASLARARELFSRRETGEPIAYLLGKREFYGRQFKVSPATLIPRPETEILVEQALARLRGQLSAARRADAGSLPLADHQTSVIPAKAGIQPVVGPVIPAKAGIQPVVTSEFNDGVDSGLRRDDGVSHAACVVADDGVDHRLRILDLGTGSGAIAISIALEHSEAQVTACDISHDALSIAKENARQLHANVEFIHSDWYANLTGKFDLIVANPPYVARGDVHLGVGDLRFEPKSALTDESDDGLGAICTIINGAAAHLYPQGWLLFEHGFDQAEAARAWLLKAGFTNLTTIADLAGISRVAGGQIR